MAEADIAYVATAGAAGLALAISAWAWRLRARLNTAGQVELFPQQGSGVLTSLVWADGLVDIPPGQTVALGEWVNYIPLANLV